MRRRGFLLVKIAIALVLVFLVYSIVDQQFNQNKLDEEIAAQAEKVEQLADEVDRLNYDLSIAGTDEFYERYARIRLGYYHYGDVIYVTDEK